MAASTVPKRAADEGRLKPRPRALRALSTAALALLLAGCSAAPGAPNGCIAYSPAVPLVATLGRVCATQLDEHYAVSVRHGDDQLVFEHTIVDPDYDLVFFRHEGVAPQWRDAVVGEVATAEGNPSTALDFLLALPVPTRETASGHANGLMTFCGTKEVRLTCTQAIIFSGPVGPGYSGGPLVGSDGKIIGIMVAKDRVGQNLGIALPTALIQAEFKRLVSPRQE